MSTQGSMDVFQREREWLVSQPGMTPWEEGCPALKRLLDRWLDEYSQALCEKPIGEGQAGYLCYFRRLWLCLGHHWRQAVAIVADGKIEGIEVGRRVQSGQGYVRGGRLGGDPLRDVVLAVAVTKRDNRATGHFQTDYFDFSKGLAGKVDPRFRLDPDEWWDDFLDHLAGYTRPPGKLERFGGRCALQNWLGAVLWHFLRRRPVGSAARPSTVLDDNHPHPEPNRDDPARRECIDLFAKLLAPALNELPKQDRLILSLLCIDGLKLKEVALILGIHSGNAGRQRDRATKSLCELVAAHAAEMEKQDAYQECLNYLTEESKSFAHILREALEEHYRRERER